MTKLASSRFHRLNIAATAVAAAILSVSTGCKTSPEPVFDPRAIQRPEREQAHDARTYPMRPLPTALESSYLPPKGAPTGKPHPTQHPPTTGPALEADRILRMPLEEVVHRAVMNNLDVKVAGYNPAIEGTRTVENEARFDPTYFASGQWEHRNNRVAVGTGLSGPGNIDRAEIFTAQTGLRQNLGAGGQVELTAQSTFTDAHNPVSTSLNPFVESQYFLKLTQPLLQNFGNEINRARINISRNNQRISVLDFRKQIEETTADIEKFYWQLAQAERDVRINERLLQETLRTADILIKRIDQDVTRVQISQANASLETRRAALVRSRARVRDLSDQLKTLMNDPELPVTSQVLILPGAPPLEEPVQFNLEDEIATAMENRFELGQQQFRIDSAHIATQVAVNNLLPALNLQGQIGIQGLGEDYLNAFDDQTEYGRMNYQLGLQLEIPIGNRAARAVYRRARLQQQQAIDQYAQLVSKIAFEVSTARREVETTWNEMVQTRQARFAHADALAAIEQREAGGEPPTPTFVQLKLQQQEQLADAARAESQAIANYNIAISALERAKGTLLRYNNVIMQEDKVLLSGQQ